MRGPLAIAVLSMLLAAGPAAAAEWMRLSLPDGTEALAEVMLSPEERERGLMFRDALPESRLMLFHYRQDGIRRLWMKNCRFAIDAAWLNAEGRVLWVEEGLPPCKSDPCPVYGPDFPARYFVEGTAGWAAARQVRVGAVLGLGERLPGQPPAGTPK